MSDIDASRARIAAGLGVWLIVIPFVPGVIALGNVWALASYTLLGAGIALTAGYTWWAAQNDGDWAPLASAASGVLGLWLMTIPFQPMGTATGWLSWNDILVGAAVAWIGFKNAYRGLDVSIGPSTSVDRPG